MRITGGADVYYQFVRTYKTVHVAVRVMLHDIPGYSIYRTDFFPSISII